MTHQAEIYFSEGCGRCSLGGTPDCKVHRWPRELALLRRIVLDCGLHEEVKWGIPCYTYHQKNIVLIGAFKEFCSFSFFKGALLEDPEQILEKPGQNTQAARIIRFTNFERVLELEDILKAYIFDAIELEKSGQKIILKQTSEFTVPEELERKMEEIPLLKQAFYSLTPGRQRAYLLYFSEPKQQKTRESRIEKYLTKILSGKGFTD